MKDNLDYKYLEKMLKERLTTLETGIYDFQNLESRISITEENIRNFTQDLKELKAIQKKYFF